MRSRAVFLVVTHGEFDFERPAAMVAGHRWNVGNHIIRADHPDQTVKFENIEVPAAFILAGSFQSHAARLHGTKGPVTHGSGLLDPGEPREARNPHHAAWRKAASF